MTPAPGVNTIGPSPAREPRMDTRKLLDALRDGIPLTRRPFESLGRACGASEDEVLRGLRRLCENGVLADPAPLPPPRPGAAPTPAPGSFDARLLEILAGGFPLLPNPYEAIAAILGTSEAHVLGRLDALVDAGVIGRIGMRPLAVMPPSPSPLS